MRNDATFEKIEAWLYFQEKNYAEAARSYELFAKQSTAPEADWRLLQFYLADYANRKTDFWKKMHEILDPANSDRFRPDAEKLKGTLQTMRIPEE